MSKSSATEPVRDRNWAQVVLTTVAFGLVVAICVLGWRSLDDLQARRHQEAALEAARAVVPKTLTYSTSTLDRDLANARAAMSPSYAEKFTGLADQVIKPAVNPGPVSTHATVLRSSVVESGTHRVTVLLLVRQEVASAGRPPTGEISAVEAVMAQNGDRWLIADLRVV